jgi:hypothetical protein
MGSCGLDSSGSGKGSVAGSCEYRYRTLGLSRGREVSWLCE